ncbi:MAG: nucleotidyltransferase family protein [Pseudomonadota bacterium]|nr:nucleotidyltransferase family protein [Pseudomonadota bacterium]
MSNKPPRIAMVLAAGLGKRLRPITESTPKPLLKVSGRPLLDYCLDHSKRAGVERVVINVHYLSDKIRHYINERKDISIKISDESNKLLETGGGVQNALSLVGSLPFYVLNGDVLWLDGPSPALQRLANAWDNDAMDALLLLHSTVEAYGYSGLGDFLVDPLGRLERRPERMVTPYFFAGVQILHPRLFDNVRKGTFSLNLLYDKAMEKKRLFGIIHDGDLFHIGTPKGLAQAQNYFEQRFPGNKRR